MLDGRSRYLGKYGTEESREKYEQLISSWIASNRQLPQESGGPSDLTINELLLAYLRFAEAYYVKNGKPTSEYTCVKVAIRPLQELHGGCHGALEKQPGRGASNPASVISVPIPVAALLRNRCRRPPRDGWEAMWTGREYLPPHRSRYRETHKLTETDRISQRKKVPLQPYFGRNNCR